MIEALLGIIGLLIVIAILPENDDDE